MIPLRRTNRKNIKELLNQNPVLIQTSQAQSRKQKITSNAHTVAVAYVGPVPSIKIRPCSEALFMACKQQKPEALGILVDLCIKDSLLHRYRHLRGIANSAMDTDIFVQCAHEAEEYLKVLLISP